jgi:peptide/nickel transport system permease protein
MSPRTRFLVRRLLLTIPTLLAMSVFVFLLIRLVPGDPVRTMLGFRATPENVATVRAQLHLDDSLPAQYVSWLTGIFSGDLGQDYISGVSVGTLIGQRLPVTAELVVLAMAFGVAVGVPLGVLAARGHRWTSRFADGFVVAGVSVPDFWLGTLLVLLFAATLGWLPPSGWSPLSDGLGQNLRHALRNAALPIVTVVGIQSGVLLGAAIVVETIFGLPGLGRLVVTAIDQRNYTVVQGGVLVIAALFIFITLLTDLLYGWLDPRVGEST